MAYNYDKFDKSITEFVKENNIQSSTDYLLITSLKDKFTYVYEYKNGWELNTNGVLQLENCQHQL